MRFIWTIIIGVWLITCKSNDTPSYNPSPNISKIFQVKGSHLPFIKAKINDKEAVFLIDTGASTSILDANQNEKYNLLLLENFESFVNGIGGSNIEFFVMNVNEIEIQGKRHFINFKATDLQTMTRVWKRELGVNVLGVIGSDFFEANKVVIDYENKNLIFK